MPQAAVRALAAVTLALVVIFATTIRGESVHLKNGITASGEILRYDESGVLLRLATNQTREFATSEILKVEAAFCADHRTGDANLGKRDFATAIKDYERALLTEERSWARQRIRASLIRSFAGVRRWNDAAEQYVLLSADAVDSSVLAAAPLVWIERPTEGGLDRNQARRWLADGKNKTVQLMAASWLIGTEDESSAVTTLEQLQTERDVRIGALARAQMWRRRDRRADKQELARFARVVEQIPAPMRRGPQFVLATAYERANQPLDASLAYLWIVFSDNPPYEMAGESLFRAARASEQAGLTQDAEKLFRELTVQYSGTPWSEQAQRRLAAKTKS